MKTIVVLSDIHYPTRLNIFPYEKIEPYIKKADYVFGLGDYDTREGLDLLYGFNKDLYAVSGNMDDYSIKASLPSIITVKIENVNVGLAHGWGAPFGLREKILKQFTDVDLICYGHTHSEYFKKDYSVWFFNPGSVSGANPSFGFLTIDKKKIDAKIIRL